MRVVCASCVYIGGASCLRVVFTLGALVVCEWCASGVRVVFTLGALVVCDAGREWCASCVYIGGASGVRVWAGGLSAP